MPFINTEIDEHLKIKERPKASERVFFFVCFCFCFQYHEGKWLLTRSMARLPKVAAVYCPGVRELLKLPSCPEQLYYDLPYRLASP